MQKLNRVMILSLIALAFTACGGGSSSKNVKPASIPALPTTQVPQFTNLTQCQNPNLNIGGQVGIPGNTACPYQGSFNAQLGYQGYAFHYSVGVGFRIDFGWDYNDMCPQIGQRPVFQNGGFSHCTSVNPLFAQVDEVWYSQPNTGECAGDQLNPEVTGCRSDLKPIQVPHYNIPPSQQLNPAPIDPVLTI